MRLRVAFVMPGVGVVPRGAEAFVVDLCSALARRGDFEITLFCRRPDPGLPFRQVRVRVLRRDQPVVESLYRASRLGRKLLDTLFLDPVNLEWDTAALSALPGLWRGRFEVVVMEGGLVGGWLCRTLRRARGVPFVDIAHGVSPKWEGAFARQRPDRVVAFTRAAARTIEERAPRAQVAVIPHGVDLELFTPGREAASLDLEPPLVVVAGAVDEHKRIHLALEAVALGRGSLLVLGDGPEAAALDRLAADRLGPLRYRRLQVERSEMPRYYRAAQVVTLPSLTESFGLVYLEAMACGRPVIAPDDEVRREVIGEAGAFCDPCDPGAYARTLAAVVDRDWGGLPRRRAERFPFARTAEAYAELLRALGRAKGPASKRSR